METRAPTPDSTSMTSTGPPATAEEVATERDCANNLECGADSMVGIELEAAEALAGLAHSVFPDSGTRGLNEEGQPSRRVKTESPVGDSAANPVASDQTAVVQQQCENICSIMMEGAKVEQDAELPGRSPVCSTSYASFSGSKSRQKLTEDEKETRRIRRVLANRESARQTIRRRQALHEELTRKAASLAWENKNLKKEKELAVKEYDSLKSTNECLKAQMAKTMKSEVEETQVDSKSTNAEISTSSCTNRPFLIYNQPSYTPIFWPAIIQSSNPVQLQNGSQNSIVVPLNVPMPAIAKPDSFHEQENPPKINDPGTPLYIMPCPWFFPLPDHGNGFQPGPSFDLNDEQNGTSMNNRCSASSSSIAHAEKNHPSLPIKVKTEASSSTEAIAANNLHETPFVFLSDGGGQHTGIHPKEVVLMPAPQKLVGQLPDYAPNVQTSSSTVSHTVTALPEMKQDLVVCPSRKKLDVAAAAAEARKRRKELTKLKSLHCRQFRMGC